MCDPSYPSLSLRLRSIDCPREGHQWPLSGLCKVFGNVDDVHLYKRLHAVTSLTLPPGAPHHLLTHLPSLTQLHCTADDTLFEALEAGAVFTALRHLSVDDVIISHLPPWLCASLHSLAVSQRFHSYSASSNDSYVTHLRWTKISHHDPNCLRAFTRLQFLHLDFEYRPPASHFFQDLAKMQPMPALSIDLGTGARHPVEPCWELSALAEFTTLCSLALPETYDLPFFPLLTHLRLDRVCLAESPLGRPLRFPVNQTSLRSLTLFHIVDAETVTWIASLTSLTHLTIDRLRPEYCEAIENHPRLELVRVINSEPPARHSRLEAFARSLRMCKVSLLDSELAGLTHVDVDLTASPR